MGLSGNADALPSRTEATALVKSYCCAFGGNRIDLIDWQEVKEWKAQQAAKQIAEVVTDEARDEARRAETTAWLDEESEGSPPSAE